MNKETVCAVIVTYNREDLLLECLDALRRQTSPVDAIYIIDNASTDNTPQRLFVNGFIPECQIEPINATWVKEFEIRNLTDGKPIKIHYARMSENIGGAGGFYEGVKRGYEAGYDWLWLMDDDAKPAADCLEHLLGHAKAASVLVPVQIDSYGRKYGAGYWRCRFVPAHLEGDEGTVKVELFTFVGPLIHRTVCQTVGYPNKEFFICGDDWEYAIRIRQLGFTTIAVKNAIVYHDFGEPVAVCRFGLTRIRDQHPAWRYYYSTRNTLLMIRNLNFPDRLLSFVCLFLLYLRGSIGDIIYGPSRKERTRYRWLGVFHGLMGWTGKRIDPTKRGSHGKESGVRS